MSEREQVINPEHIQLVMQSAQVEVSNGFWRERYYRACAVAMLAVGAYIETVDMIVDPPTSITHAMAGVAVGAGVGFEGANRILRRRNRQAHEQADQISAELEHVPLVVPRAPEA